jgi:sugar transferase (PEP-CTERM system associated)
MRTFSFRLSVSVPTVLVATTELLVFAAILYPTLALTQGNWRSASTPSLLGATLAGTGLFCFSMWLVGAYDHWHLRDWGRNGRRIFFALVIVLGACLLLYAKVPPVQDLPGTEQTLGTSPWLQGLALALAFAGAVASRFGFGRTSLLPYVRQKILVLGAGEWAARIEAVTMGGDGEPGFAVVGYVSGRSEPTRLRFARALPSDAPIVALARRLRVTEIVVATADRQNLPLSALLECRLHGIKVTDYLTFWERETGTVMLDALDPSWLIYSDGFNVGTIQRGLKRLLDLLLSALVLIAFLPMLVAAAIAIRIDSAGPIFHKQVRVGRNGVPFTIYKFRSMRVDAEKDGPQWAARQDRRITRVGAILRRLHIDEIPQVLNVLRGEMSVVGPRPERPFFVDRLSRELHFYAERHSVQPGITGWAQINYRYGASDEDSKAKLAYDLYYVKNYSFGLDLVTLFRTVQAILWPHGVH